MDTRPAEQVGRVGAGGREKPPPGVFASQRCRREQATDQGVAVAHGPQQQLRRRRRLVAITPEPVRTKGVYEKRDPEASRMVPAASPKRSIAMARSLRLIAQFRCRVCLPSLLSNPDASETLRSRQKGWLGRICRILTPRWPPPTPTKIRTRRTLGAR